MRKKLVALALVSAMLLCVFPPGYAEGSSAQESQGRIIFESSAPDSDGLFTVTMTMYDVAFEVFQFALRYDTQVIQPVEEDGTPTKSFGRFAEEELDWLSTVGTEVNTETGLIDFSAYIMPGESADILNENGEAVVKGEGLVPFIFHFKRLKEGDSGLQVATEEKGEPYRRACPQGVIVANRQGDCVVTVMFRETLNPDSETSETFAGETPIVTSSPSPAVTASPSPVVTASPSPVVTASPSPAVTASPSPAVTASPSPAVTASPSPAVTPEPSAVPSQLPAEPEKKVEDLLNQAVVLKIGSHAAIAEAGVVAIYPGEREVTAYAHDNRTFVPVRFVSERLGAEVDWEGDTQTVVVRKGSHVIRVAVGALSYTLDGEEKILDVPAEFTPSTEGNFRTMVPVRFVSEALGYQVEWDRDRNLVIVAPPELGWDPDGKTEGEAMDEAVRLLASYSMFV